GGWIRTTEARRNRFTVCPLWPLGNSSIFIFPPKQPRRPDTSSIILHIEKKVKTKFEKNTKENAGGGIIPDPRRLFLFCDLHLGAPNRISAFLEHQAHGARLRVKLHLPVPDAEGLQTE